MARPRKPVEVLRRNGTARPCRVDHRANELSLAGRFPDAPAWLGAAARAEWARVREISDFASCITQADHATLVVYCHLYGELAEAGEISGTKWTVLIRTASKLGMTPTEKRSRKDSIL